MSVRGTVADGGIDEDGVVKSRETLGNNGTSYRDAARETTERIISKGEVRT